MVIGTIEELDLLKSDGAGEAASDRWVQGEEGVQGCGSWDRHTPEKIGSRLKALILKNWLNLILN